MKNSVVTVCVVHPADSDPLQRCLWPLLSGDVFGPCRKVRLRLCNPADLSGCRELADCLLDSGLAPGRCWDLLATDSLSEALEGADYCLVRPASLSQPCARLLNHLLRTRFQACTTASRPVVLALVDELGQLPSSWTELQISCGEVVVKEVSCPTAWRGLAACQRLCRLMAKMEATRANSIELLPLFKEERELQQLQPQMPARI